MEEDQFKWVSKRIYNIYVFLINYRYITKFSRFYSVWILLIIYDPSQSNTITDFACKKVKQNSDQVWLEANSFKPIPDYIRTVRLEAVPVCLVFCFHFVACFSIIISCSEFAVHSHWYQGSNKHRSSFSNQSILGVHIIKETEAKGNMLMIISIPVSFGLVLRLTVATEVRK